MPPSFAYRLKSKLSDDFTALRLTRRRSISSSTRKFKAHTHSKKNRDQKVSIFLGGGGEIRTPATGLPILTI